MTRRLSPEQIGGYVVTHNRKKNDNVFLFDETLGNGYLEALNKSTSRPQVDRNNYWAKSPQSLISIAFETIKALKMQPRRALHYCVDVALRSLSQCLSVSRAATLMLKEAQG